MRKKLASDRQAAIRRYLDGESPVNIWTSLGYSKQWLYRWLKRWKQEDCEFRRISDSNPT